MNEPSSALPTAAIDLAARAIEAAKLQVIDRDWQSGEHRLDLVATPGDGILAAVEVRAVAHGTTNTCITAISEDRIRQLTSAGREWIREHDTHHDDLWLVIVTVDPDGYVELVVGNVVEVARMDARVKSATLSGVDGRVLEVTAIAGPGLPQFEQRGLHGWSVGQRAERVWSAVTASGLPWPRSKITVTAAPDWLPKHDSAIDLAIAIAVLAADCAVPCPPMRLRG